MGGAGEEPKFGPGGGRGKDVWGGDQKSKPASTARVNQDLDAHLTEGLGLGGGK